MPTDHDRSTDLIRLVIADRKQAAAVLELHGEVDIGTAPDLEAVAAELIDAGATDLTLDCEHLTYLDSSGLRVIAALDARLPTGSVLVRNPSRIVAEVLAATGLAYLVEDPPEADPQP